MGWDVSEGGLGGAGERIGRCSEQIGSIAVGAAIWSARRRRGTNAPGSNKIFSARLNCCK